MNLDNCKPLVSFMWLGTPPRTTAQQRRHTSRGTYRSPAHKLAVATLRAVAEQHAPAAPFAGPLVLNLDFYFLKEGVGNIPVPKTTRPDRDNLQKDMQDALEKTGYVKDDAQFFDGRTGKWWAEFEGIRVEILPYRGVANGDALR